MAKRLLNKGSYFKGFLFFEESIISLVKPGAIGMPTTAVMKLIKKLANIYLKVMICERNTNIY